MMRATKIAFMLLFLNMGSITGIASDPQRDGVHGERPPSFPLSGPPRPAHSLLPATFGLVFRRGPCR